MSNLLHKNIRGKYNRAFFTLYDTEWTPPKTLRHVSKVRILGFHIWRSCVQRCLLLVPTLWLDAAIEKQVGRLPKKSQIIRFGHQSFNEGYQQARKDLDETKDMAAQEN